MSQPAPDPAQIFPHAPWRHLMARAVQPAAAVPTMLSEEEQKLYFWLTALWAQDAGAVVDLGCFAGGSTARLAAGAAAAGSQAAIHAYDRFTADEAVKANTLYSAGIAPFAGHDILPLAQTLLAPWQDRITLHPGEIEDHDWTGGPIEILIVDAAKSAGTADAIAAGFFPHLLPGRSLVVQQDCLHRRLPWLPTQMHLLRPCFTPVARCGPTSVIYLCTRAPSPSALQAARLEGQSDQQLLVTLGSAQADLAHLGAEDILDEMAAMIHANPGERVAWRMRPPAG